MNQRTDSPRRVVLMLQVGAIVIAYFGLFGALLYALHEAASRAA